MKPQLRLFNVNGEMRTSSTGNGAGRVEGYAAVYGKRSEMLCGGMFQEQLEPGCFAQALADPLLDVRFLHNHDPNTVFGRTRSGTLQLKADETGLYAICDMPDTESARTLVESIKRGDISQMSFAFDVPSDGTGDTWTWDPGINAMLHVVKRVSKLFDVCTATYPAYKDTTIGARGGVEMADLAIAMRSLQAGSAVDPEGIKRMIAKLSALIDAPPPAPPEVPAAEQRSDREWLAGIIAQINSV